MDKRRTWVTSEHPLAVAIKGANTTPAAVARETKVPLATISRVLTKRRKRFSPEAARKIRAMFPSLSFEDLLYG